MDRKQITNVLLIFFLLLSLYPIKIHTVHADGDYIIDGETVYIDDDNVYLSATPHTIMEDTWVEFELISKKYSGDIDVAFGINSELMKPCKPQRWNGDNWVRLNKDIETKNVEHQGFDKWYLIKNVNVNEDVLYKIRVFIDIQFNTSGKYFFGVKRSVDPISSGYYIDPWWDSNWAWYTVITIDHDYIDSDLTNFPVKINISDSIGDMCDGGDSVRFLNLDNTTEYFYEFEKWVDGSDRICFVNVTSVTSASDTQFLLYYNNSDASDNQNNNSVWDSNFVGIYHMADASGDLIDSTGNRDGHPMGVGLPFVYQQAGHIGYSIDFNGNDEWVNITDSVYEFVDDWTIEAVVNLDVYDTKYRTAVFLGDDDNDPYTMLYRNAKNEAHEGFWNYARSGGSWDRARSTVEGNDCTIGWFYLGGPHEAGVETYLNTNGDVTREGLTGVSVNLASGTEFYADIAGHPTNNNYRWDGRIDEIRISNIARSEAWLNATWHTFNTDALISFGSPVNQSNVLAPTYMNVTQVSTSQIDLNWTQGENSTHTYVERHTTSSWNRGDGTEIYNSTGLLYSDTYSGFSCGTRYYYQAWGYNNTLNTFSTDATSENNITCPGNPTSVTTVIYTNALNITWTNNSLAETTVLVRKLNGYPTSVSDGTILYNGTNEYYNDTNFNTSVNYRLYTWNETVDEHSSGVNAPYGSFVINVYDENTSLAIANWDIFITDQTGDNTYESLNNSNPLTIDVNDIPYGDDTIIIINSTGYDAPWYNSKVFVMDLEPNLPYTLDAYLSETNATELYFFYVVNILDEPIPDAAMNIKRYINDTVGWGNASILLTDAAGQASCYLVPDEIYLIIISKNGYETETSEYIPDPDYYGPYYSKTFQLLFSEPDIKFITIADLHFNGTINSAGTIQIWYDDPFLQTMNTEIQIYQEYNGTLSWNHTDTRTADHSFTFTDTGYNTSMRHKCILYVNHSNLDGYSEYIYFFIEPIRSTMATGVIEDYWIDVFGDWELGFVPTILVFLPALFLLVVFGAGHIGLGIMVTGMYLGFTTYMLDLSNAVSLVAIGSMLAVSGFVLIIAKRGRKAV